ncbi:RNA polymerase I associated factor, A49-like protein [Hymenopellis radicata]|nr:RNA polymerase I associated factor, A49-like protein [Hymenopellis radicata]
MKKAALIFDVVSFPAVEAPQDTPFKCYAQKKRKSAKEKDDANPSSSGMIVVGETDDMEFFSNEGENQEAEQSGCSRYMLAVHNKRDSSVKLLPTAVPLHILKQKVKALKSVPSAAEPSALAYFEARNALGESFGTKKAKANIRAQERNKVDVSAMQGVMDHLMDGIEKNAEGLPTQEEAKDVADASRLIPPYNDTTKDPADVYALHDIVPESEWKSIVTSPFDQAKSLKDKQALFPSRNSSWVNRHLKSLQGTSVKGVKKKIKLVYCVSAMLAFRRAINRREIDRAKVEEQLKGVPSNILDGMFNRFTEVSRGSTEHRTTPAMETKLLAYLFALCLKADGYASDPSLLSADLGIPVTRVNQQFKSLGCTLKTLTDKERSKLGYSNDSAGTKMAVLTAPVKFPKPPMRKGRK